ncbi:MAG: nitronate monooxygenase [Candidatus Aquicultor sp.]|nr:nitronate monooxygenase [Candidatus Aquicultor sp.]
MSLPSLHIGDLTASKAVVQGGMAVRISMAKLAAAVANEGGIGLIAASGLKPAELVENIRAAKKMSKGIIGINVMVALTEFANLVKAAIKERIDLVVAGAGFSRDAFKWCADANIPFVPIVSSVKAAKMSERLGAAAVILEGKEAGGHLGTLESTWDVLPSIVDAVDIPIIAAGGILTGGDIARALGMGASGVQIGSRFAVSEESNAALAWKEACIAAEPEDVLLVQSPVGLPGRALNSPFVKKLMSIDEDAPKEKVKCVKCLKECKKNFCIIDVLVKAQQGDLENGLIFCGERIGEIKEILSVKEIFRRLVEEYDLATRPVSTYG